MVPSICWWSPTYFDACQHMLVTSQHIINICWAPTYVGDLSTYLQHMLITLNICWHLQHMLITASICWWPLNMLPTYVGPQHMLVTSQHMSNICWSPSTYVGTLNLIEFQMPNAKMPILLHFSVLPFCNFAILPFFRFSTFALLQGVGTVAGTYECTVCMAEDYADERYHHTRGANGSIRQRPAAHLPENCHTKAHHTCYQGCGVVVYWQSKWLSWHAVKDVHCTAHQQQLAARAA